MRADIQAGIIERLTFMLACMRGLADWALGIPMCGVVVEVEAWVMIQLLTILYFTLMFCDEQDMRLGVWAAEGGARSRILNVSDHHPAMALELIV